MDLNEAQICADFDRLSEDGAVVFNKNYRTITSSDNGFQFEFRILSGLAHKPGASAEQTPSPPLNSRCRPGSDIDVSGTEITDVGSTHLLAFNMFPAARPHFLLVTQDGFRRQHEELDRDDMTALWQVMSSFKQKRYLAIFNCGINAGCSRLHKHMQLFPAPAPDDFALWPDRDDDSARSALPFQCFVHRFQNGFPSVDTLTAIYQTLLRQAENAVGCPAKKEREAIPHNVVLDRKWIMVTPRRTAGLNGAGANAAAMLGMVWVANEEMLNLWTELGPANVLAHVGIPAGVSY
ncbi:hypothetical protein C8A01DRAFT_18285 [Parachaetomium inaequale]|uniref:Phosphorylase n=1 Tax=Parachaetomium inaequale TaxID=2588326 RepID=A0AAN6PFB2_9PEZI|nr:hypothetical protein C8A01DRAFT_18285 [Parachaetomium inaequale]